MPSRIRSLFAVTAFAAAAAVTATAANAQKKYDVGASDTEIKIGNIMPYSGPASALWGDRQDAGGLFQENQ